MKESVIKVAKFSAFLSIGIILLYFAFRGINLQEVWHDLKTAKYSWIILSLFCALLSHMFRAYRWNLIIEPLGYKPHFINTFYALMTGYLANFALPRIGEITRCASLAKKEKIPADKLLGTVIVERVIDLLSLLLLLLLLLIMKFETFGEFINTHVFAPLTDQITNLLDFSWIIWIILLAFFVATAFLYYFYLHEILSKYKTFNRFKKIVKGIFDGLKTVYKMKRKTEFILYTAIMWFLYFLMTWVVVFSLPATSELKMIDGLYILVIGALGMSAPVQSGIGVFHWIVSRGIAAVYPHIAVEQGLAFATISHGSQTLLLIALGAFSFFMLMYEKKWPLKNDEIVPPEPVYEKKISV